MNDCPDDNMTMRSPSLKNSGGLDSCDGIDLSKYAGCNNPKRKVLDAPTAPDSFDKKDLDDIFGKPALFGELYIDDEDEAHFICHTPGNMSFDDSEIVIQKFIDLLQLQLDCKEGRTKL